MAERVNLALADYVPLDCACPIEDRLRAQPGVLDAVVNTVAHVVQVEYNPEETTLEDIKGVLVHCGHQCHGERGHTAHAHLAHAEHQMEGQDHHAMMEGDFQRRFLVSLAVTLPILALSPTIQDWLGLVVLRFAGSHYLLFGLATVVALYGGWPFYQGAGRSLRLGVLDMNVLVSVAVLSGYVFSAGATFLFVAVDFYWEISTLVVVLLFGHWLEMRAERGASGALQELVKLIPPMANRIQDGEVREVPTADLAIGDLLLVRPGEKVPIDGLITEGETTVNEAMITGESRPVPKGPGDQVIGGTISGEGAIQVRVNRAGDETALAQIVNLVKAAQASKPRTQRLADRAAHYLTLVAILVGAATLAFWWLVAGQPFVFALTLAITVVVITCPHALGLAIPTVTTIAVDLLAKNGMLLRNAQALEMARNVTTVVFDKTGTLTSGEFGVAEVLSLGGWSEDKVLAKAAAIETNSEHLIARGIARAAQERGLLTDTASGFAAIPGHGARATVAGQEIHLGNRALMERVGVPMEVHDDLLGKLAAQGKTLVHLASDGKLEGVIALADLIRPESQSAVRELTALGVSVAMLTGDNRNVAEHVAGELGLDSFFAEVLPQDKAGKVRELQSRGYRVAMVGDGVNDAPALVQADVGIAIGAGTDVAVESADVVLVRNDPRDVVKLIRLSRATMRKMGQNLAWATGYNVLAIPAAAGVLAPLGIVLRPEWGALMMAASSIIVVLNALLLRRAEG